MWLTFSKLKLVRWGWLSGTISILIGAFILATFLALFNHLTPSGKVTVAGRVIEVTPNVAGQVIAIPVKPNVAVKSGDILFQLDPAPFQYKVAQLQASLAAAKQQTQILKANYDQATANVAGLDAQYKYNAKRLQDIQTLYASGSNTEFKEQDTQVQFETVRAQLNVARATQQSAKLALDSDLLSHLSVFALLRPRPMVRCTQQITSGVCSGLGRRAATRVRNCNDGRARSLHRGRRCIVSPSDLPRAEGFGLRRGRF
nr:biotin/lipoyl-binding protein [Bradyrhizobium sp. 35]